MPSIAVTSDQPRQNESKQLMVAVEKLGEGTHPSDAERAERTRVVAMWYRILLDIPEEGVGLLVSREFFERGREAALSVLSDAFATKATGTLLVRASALTQYLAWAKRAGVAAFLVKEAVAYRYVVYLRSIHAPPTRATSFRGALGFIQHVLGIESCQDAVRSKRVSGAAFKALEQA
jgi:hypothetical protein